MEIPKPESINFVGMKRREQNAWYEKHVRGLIAWMLEQEDLPDKFRRPLETVDDYTYYLGYQVGYGKEIEENHG